MLKLESQNVELLLGSTATSRGSHVMWHSCTRARTAARGLAALAARRLRVPRAQGRGKGNSFGVGGVGSKQQKDGQKLQLMSEWLLCGLIHLETNGSGKSAASIGPSSFMVTCPFSCLGSSPQKKKNLLGSHAHFFCFNSKSIFTEHYCGNAHAETRIVPKKKVFQAASNSR